MPTDFSYTCLSQKIYSLDQYSICSIRKEDISLIRDWRNKQMDVLRQKFFITEDEQTNYYNTHIWPSFVFDEPKQILVSFLFKDELIGYGGLVHISWEDKRAELSFLLNPDRHSHKQYFNDFTAFINLMKYLSFVDLGFHRLFTETYEFRNFHISILEKNGFILEGVMKDHIIIEGKTCNSIIHGCLNF